MIDLSGWGSMSFAFLALFSCAAELIIFVAAGRFELPIRIVFRSILPVLSLAAFLYSLLASVRIGQIPYPPLFSEIKGELLYLPGAAAGAVFFGFILLGVLTGAFPGALVGGIHSCSEAEFANSPENG